MTAAALRDLGDLLMPRRCIGCRVPGVALCVACVPPTDPFAVHVADLTDVPVWAAASYEGGLRRAVIAYKERGRRDLVRPLGALLAAAVAQIGGPAPVVLVAPPSTRAAAARRGGDHVRRLARVAATGSRRVTVASGVLAATRTLRDSAGLGVDERERNLAGALVAGPPRGRSAVVVDDIVTTGATLREAVRALRMSGWPVLGAATIAATPRRFLASPLAGPHLAV